MLNSDFLQFYHELKYLIWNTCCSKWLFTSFKTWIVQLLMHTLISKSIYRSVDIWLFGKDATFKVLKSINGPDQHMFEPIAIFINLTFSQDSLNVHRRTDSNWEFVIQLICITHKRHICKKKTVGLASRVGVVIHIYIPESL